VTAEGARAYSDPTEMMEKRKRCCERAERMRKAYRRRLREDVGPQCLSATTDAASAAELQGSPATSRSRHADEDLAYFMDFRSIRQDCQKLKINRHEQAKPLLSEITWCH